MYQELRLNISQSGFKLFEPFLRCLDHFEQLISFSSFVGEVWFQQDHSGNVHQRPRQGADAFNAAVNVASFSAVAQAAVLGLLLGTPVLAVVLWLLGRIWCAKGAMVVFHQS